MALSLNHIEQEEFKNALLKAFPKIADLRQLTYFKLGVNLDEHVNTNSNLSQCVMELIQWGESESRTEELILAALKERPTNVYLVRFATKIGLIAPHLNATNGPTQIPLNRPPHVGRQNDAMPTMPRINNYAQNDPPPTVSPTIPDTLLKSLVEALTNIPMFRSAEGRDTLLIGLPNTDKLNRYPNNMHVDLMFLVEQLSQFHRLSTGKWPLLVLLDNALALVEGYISYDDLQKLRQQFEHYYQGV